jgi:hypothetical protein
VAPPHDQPTLEQERSDPVALPTGSEEGRHEAKNEPSRPGGSEIASNSAQEPTKPAASGPPPRVAASTVSSGSDRPGEQAETAGAFPHAKTASGEPVVVLVWVTGHPSG